MKLKLIEIRYVGIALSKVISSDISLTLRHKLNIYRKKIEPELKVMDENQDQLIKKYDISDIQMEAKLKTDKFIELDKEFGNYLTSNESEMPDSDLVWSDIMKFGDFIQISAQEEIALKLVFKDEK
jgi:hypothetical protein